jgi:hypothetical protein
VVRPPKNTLLICLLTAAVAAVMQTPTRTRDRMWWEIHPSPRIAVVIYTEKDAKFWRVVHSSNTLKT